MIHVSSSSHSCDGAFRSKGLLCLCPGYLQGTQKIMRPPVFATKSRISSSFGRGLQLSLAMHDTVSRDSDSEGTTKIKERSRATAPSIFLRLYTDLPAKYGEENCRQQVIIAIKG